jgi:hypothetical protein
MTFLQPIRDYPFIAKGAVKPMRRGTYRPCDKWSEPGDRTKAGDVDLMGPRGPLSAAEALADPRIPQSLRQRVVSAVMVGGGFAQEVGSEIAEMVDDGRLDPATAAAIMRALNPREDMDGDYQAGTGDGGDAVVATGDAWARRGSDPWAGGKGPVGRDVAPAPGADASGFLYPPELKRRTLQGLAKYASERTKRKLTRLERKCELIEQGPFNVKPEMRAIEKQIEREFRAGLLAA